MVAGICNQPVVPVDEIEGEAIAKLDARRQHVGVHPLDPGDELAQVRRPLRLTDAVDGGHDPGLAPAHDRNTFGPAGAQVTTDSV